MLVHYYLIVIYVLVFTLMSFVFSSVDVIIGVCFFTVFLSVINILLNILDNMWYEEHKQYRKYMGNISLVYYNLGYMETYMEELGAGWENYFVFLKKSLEFESENKVVFQEINQKLKNWLANKLSKYMGTKEKMIYKKSKELRLEDLKTVLELKYVNKFCK